MVIYKSVLKQGTILNSGIRKYRIIKVLGQGGFGITYLASGEVQVGNVKTEAPFAIKEHFPSEHCLRNGEEVLPKENNSADYSCSKASFISEANRLHMLGTKNENIVSVNEVFEANGTAYYVMQYINGISLLSYVKDKGKLTYTEALSLLSPIMDAVDLLHHNRINHLDIKPDNIMLQDSDNGKIPVLIDFGLSKHFKKDGSNTSPISIMGESDGYSPLEQYAGIREFIPAADIYALVATLLYAITGETPKSASELKMSDLRILLAKMQLPTYLVEGICKALNKSYENRTQSISMLKADLGLGNIAEGKTKLISVVDQRLIRKRKIAFGVLATVIVLACIVFAVISHMGHHEDNSSDEAITVADSLNTSLSHSSLVNPAQLQDSMSSSSTEPQTPPTPHQSNTSSGTASTESNISDAYEGTLYLGYATWEGKIYDGKPDGTGRLTFTSAHKVDPLTSYEANPGDYFIATYDRGILTSGKLYDSEGNLLKTIIP